MTGVCLVADRSVAVPRGGALPTRCVEEIIIWFVVQATAIEEDKAIGEPVCLILLLLGPCTDPPWLSYRKPEGRSAVQTQQTK